MLQTKYKNHTGGQRDMYIYFDGVHVATVSTFDGYLDYYNEIDATNYNLLQVTDTGAVANGQPVLDS